MWLRRCVSGISALFLFVAVADARRTDETDVDATGPPTKAPSTTDALAKDIEKSVAALGYPKATADELARLARDWKCAPWKQKLSQARAAPPSKQTAEAAQVEEQATKALYETIGTEIGRCDEKDAAQYFHLSKVVRDKKAQSLGYSQLVYILGNSIGLKVSAIRVLELAPARRPSLELGHVACLVTLSDGNAMLVDVQNKRLDGPFVFDETFAKAGHDWVLEETDTSRDLPRRIQILNEGGLVGCFYDGLANVYSNAGQRDKAMSYSTKAIALNPNDATAYCTRGHGYSELGKDAEAISDLSKAIELNPKYAQAYYNRGALYAKTKESTKAVSDFTQAIALNPSWVEAYSERGSAHGKLGLHGKAISDFTKVIELSPKRAQAYSDRGYEHYKSRQYTQALYDFNKAILIDPKLAGAYYGRARHARRVEAIRRGHCGLQQGDRARSGICRRILRPRSYPCHARK